SAPVVTSPANEFVGERYARIFQPGNPGSPTSLGWPSLSRSLNFVPRLTHGSTGGPPHWMVSQLTCRANAARGVGPTPEPPGVIAPRWGPPGRGLAVHAVSAR